MEDDLQNDPAWREFYGWGYAHGFNARMLRENAAAGMRICTRDPEEALRDYRRQIDRLLGPTEAARIAHRAVDDGIEDGLADREPRG